VLRHTRGETYCLVEESRSRYFNWPTMSCRKVTSWFPHCPSDLLHPYKLHLIQQNAWWIVGDTDKEAEERDWFSI